MTILKKILFIILIIIIFTLPVIIMGYRVLEAGRELINEEILDKNLKIARLTARHLNEIVRSAQRVMEATAKYPIIINMDETHLLPLLKTLIQKYAIFNAIYIIDKTGKQVVNATNVPRVYLGKPSAIWFSSIIKGKYGDYISDLYTSNLTGKPAITIATLIRGELFKLKAVLSGELDLRYLWSYLNSLKVGKSGQIIVLDKNGLIISHPTTAYVDGKTNYKEFLPWLAKAFSISKSNDSEGTILYYDENDEPIFIAYTSIKKIDELKAVPWKVIVTQKGSIAEDQLSSLREELAYVLSITIIIGFISGTFLVFFYKPKIVEVDSTA